jgi:hypothetical protein
VDDTTGATNRPDARPQSFLECYQHEGGHQNVSQSSSPYPALAHKEADMFEPAPIEECRGSHSVQLKMLLPEWYQLRCKCSPFFHRVPIHGSEPSTLDKCGIPNQGTVLPAYRLSMRLMSQFPALFGQFLGDFRGRSTISLDMLWDRVLHPRSYEVNLR